MLYGHNQKWMTDVTEFNVGGRKLYLSPVMDLYNGEIAAYQLDRRPDFEMVSSMLKKTLAKLQRRDKPLLHSDQRISNGLNLSIAQRPPVFCALSDCRPRTSFHTAPSATGTIAAPIPTSTITFRYWRMNGILPKK